MAVVCPGHGTAMPATGRKWHRTSLSRARRNLVRPARPDQGGARALGRVLTATTARPRGGRSGNPDQAIISLGLRVPGEAPCSGSGENDKRYRRHHPASQAEPGFPVLILTIPNNPILQSCALADYNCGATLIAAQDRAYTFVISPNLLRVVLAACDAHCTFVQLRFPVSATSARHGFARFLFFLHRIRIFAGSTKAPLCKISF